MMAQISDLGLRMLSSVQWQHSWTMMVQSHNLKGGVGLRAATTWMVPVNRGQNATWDTGSGVEVSGDCPAMAGQSCDLGSRV